MAVRLPRLPPNFGAMPDRDDLLQRYWQTAMESIETTLNAILAIPAIEAALVDLDAAIIAAQAAADNANNAADAVTSEQSIVASFPTNFIAPLISAASTGVVTIADHDRQYGDTTLNPTVAVDGDTIATAQVNPAVVRVYYSDPARAGGAVTYLFTVDPAAPPVQGGGVHSVGAVTIPAAGTQNGNGVQPPGYVQP